MNNAQLREKIIKDIKDDKVVAVHYDDCECIVCCYDYPHKERISQLKLTDRPMPKPELDERQKWDLLQEIVLINGLAFELSHTKGKKDKTQKLFAIWSSLERIKERFDVESVTKGK